MRTGKISIWCAAVVLISTGCRAPAPVSAPAPDSAEVLAVVEAFHAAFAAEDPVRMGELLSGDDSFVFFGTGAGEVQRGREAFLTKHRDVDWAQLDDIELETPQEAHVQATPELAVVMYRTTLRFTAGGEEGSLPLRLVLTLVPEEGRWRIRQGLASEIAP
jgi:uncharacterized protein (TIGR02246 family)